MGKGQRLSTVRIILYRCFWLTVVECWKREHYLQALWPMEKSQRSVQWELSCNAIFDLLMYPWKWVKGQFTENYLVSLFLVDCCWMLKKGIPLASLVTHGKGSKVSAVRIIMYSCFCVRTQMFWCGNTKIMLRQSLSADSKYDRTDKAG